MKAQSKTQDVKKNKVKLKVLGSSGFWWDVLAENECAIQAAHGEAGSPLYCEALFVKMPDGTLQTNFGTTYVIVERDNGLDLQELPEIVHKGLYTNRLPNNPMEKRFAKQWEQEAPGTLGYLIYGQDKNYHEVTQHEAEVAATVVQWLGSPIGMEFLSKVLKIGLK